MGGNAEAARCGLAAARALSTSRTSLSWLSFGCCISNAMVPVYSWMPSFPTPSGSTQYPFGLHTFGYSRLFSNPSLRFPQDPCTTSYHYLVQGFFVIGYLFIPCIRQSKFHTGATPGAVPSVAARSTAGLHHLALGKSTRPERTLTHTRQA